MVLWGGLRPIASRVVVDCLTLTALSYGALVTVQTSADSVSKKETRERSIRSFLLILLACYLAIETAGSLTNRWTLTLPMVPYLLLQGIRRLTPRTNKLLVVLHFLLTTSSLACIVVSFALCILFPAVELPPVQGPYNVGKVDLFLPMKSTDGSHNHSEAVWVRLLYPTLEIPKALPYLTPQTSLDYCYHSMQFGAPPPLKKFDWMLHTWRLTERWERDGAALLDTPEPLPVVIFSHGLGGHADIYSYQTHTLAAQGNIVLTISHADGSSPAINMPSGKIIAYNYEPQRIEMEQGYTNQVIQMRRQQTEMRVQEVVAVTQAIQRWNQHDIHADLPGGKGLSLKGRLDLQHVTWIGHSFGGATVLTAAHRHPELVHTVIAHEPALDWGHPSAISSLFAHSRIANLTKASVYKHDRFGEPSHDDSIHHSANVFLLFSHEWYRKEWAMIPLLEEMQDHQRLGSQKMGTVFSFDYVVDMHHNEFSDTSMLTPLWLARAVGLTGNRNPIDTAREVADKTSAFLDKVRRKRTAK